MAGHADRTLPLILAEPCVSSPVSQKGRTSSSPYTSPGRIGGSVILVSRSVLVVAVKPSFLTYLLTAIAPPSKLMRVSRTVLGADRCRSPPRLVQTHIRRARECAVLLLLKG